MTDFLRLILDALYDAVSCADGGFAAAGTAAVGRDAVQQHDVDADFVGVDGDVLRGWGAAVSRPAGGTRVADADGHAAVSVSDAQRERFALSRRRAPRRGAAHAAAAATAAEPPSAVPPVQAAPYGAAVPDAASGAFPWERAMRRLARRDAPQRVGGGAPPLAAHGGAASRHAADMSAVSRDAVRHEAPSDVEAAAVTPEMLSRAFEREARRY